MSPVGQVIRISSLKEQEEALSEPNESRFCFLKQRKSLIKTKKENCGLILNFIFKDEAWVCPGGLFLDSGICLLLRNNNTVKSQPTKVTLRD